MRARRGTYSGCAIALPLAFLLWIALAGLALLAAYLAARHP